MKLADNN